MSDSKTPRAPFIERAIAAISPRWGAERAFYRFTLSQTRAYEAAKTGRRTEGWMTSGTSANAEIGPAAARIRARVRDLVRNNPHIAAAVRKKADKVVGTGIRPRLRATRDEVERKRAINAYWEEFANNCDPAGRLDFYGLEKLASRTMDESGEVLLRFIPRPSSWRLQVPLQIEVLEPDYLDSSLSRALNNGGAIIQGVEFDRDGRRVAYWLYPEHPGEILGIEGKFGLQSQRVPASEIIHMFDPLRPGQARGVSAFTSIVLKARDIDEADDARLMAQKLAACFAVFVKRAGNATSPLAAKTTTDKDGKRIERVSPGMIQYLDMNEDVAFGTPPSVDGYMEFMNVQLHAMAAGAGVTYEQMTGDLRGVNFSSIRAGLIDFWDLVDHQQHLVMIPQLCRPVWGRFGQVLAAQGRRDLDKAFQAIWTPPRRRYVDPEKEIKAVTDEMRSGLTSLPAAIAATGEDPDEVVHDIADSNALLDKLGIVLDSDPRNVARASAAQPGKASDQKKSDEKETEE